MVLDISHVMVCSATVCCTVDHHYSKKAGTNKSHSGSVNSSRALNVEEQQSIGLTGTVMP